MSIKYRTGLEAVGAVIPETIAILREYARTKDWTQVRNKVLRENLLRKPSSSRVNKILRRLRLRFHVNPSALPGIDLASQIAVSRMPLSAKSQILYAYHCQSDPLVEQTIRRLVKPRLRSCESELTVGDVYAFLNEEKREHSELRQWSDYLRRRWCRGFLSLLRDYGIMERAPSRRIHRPSFRIEAFTYFLLWMLENRKGFSDILRDDLWDLYMLESETMDSLLAKSQAMGWVHYLRAGDVVELSSRYSSLGAWLYELG